MQLFMEYFLFTYYIISFYTLLFGFISCLFKANYEKFQLRLYHILFPTSLIGYGLCKFFTIKIGYKK